MKTLLYAIFMLMTMTATTYANVEVTDLTLAKSEESSTFAWFWQSKKEKEKPAAPSETPSAAPPNYAAPVAEDVGIPQIALLLPLTGQFSVAATAIRDGFISAYYLNATNNLSTQTDVRIYDTKADQDVVKAYTQAIDEGANIIVGPLTKPGLETLLDGKTVDNHTIVIAMNTLEGRTHLPRYLYPYSLSPEDEAFRLAEQARQDGHQHAVGLVEKDAFGRRAAASFKKRFEQLGGQVSDVVYFDNDRPLEDPVHYLLKVEETKNGGETTFVRRRQDLDFIFLVAKPQQGRQIPPLMKFYYAQNVPIYAMANIYSGTPNPGLDNDLNGIIFCDSPWIVNPGSRNAQLNAAASQLLTQPASQERLFAFGVDAYTVVKDIKLFSANPEFGYNGATGRLSMDSSGFMVRQPQCARFVQGAPRVL